MAEVVRGVDLLQTELEKAKESLKDVDESIKKLTGRDPTIQRNITVSQRRVSLGSADSRGIERSETRGAGSNRLFSLARRGIIQDDGVKSPPSRGGAFSRLGPRPGPPSGGRDLRRDLRERGLRRTGPDSGDEDDLPNRPTLQSSVIATPKEERSRNVSIQEQSKDRKGQARNRRMFGLLLGTLQKFKEDAAETKDKEEQRIQIEKKLDEKFKQEKEDIRNERRQLFLARKQKQFRIRLIEQKMEMVANHEDWEKETLKLNNFLRTKSKPHIFYMPKLESSDMEAKLQETELAVEAMLYERRKKLEEEIAEMMSQVHDGNDDEDDGDDDGRMDEDEDEREMDVDKQRERPGDNKENDRDEDFVSERERRDKEREERDREKIMRDKAREERIRKREDGTSKEKDNVVKARSRSRSNDRSRERRMNRREKSGERDKGRDRSRDKSRDKKRDRDRSRDKERDKDRHRSGGKGRSDKRDSKRDGHDSKSHKHSSSKSKRRSRGEGKNERKEKVWEPMEDEDEDIVDDPKEDVKDPSLTSKLIAMAGMTEVMKEKEMENEMIASMNQVHEVQETLVTQSVVSLEDIPRPPEDNVEENNSALEMPT